MRKFMASVMAAAMCVQLCASPALAAGIWTDSNAPQETVTQETEAEATETEENEMQQGVESNIGEEKTDEAEIALMDGNDGVEVIGETSETASGTCGENLTWVLTSDGTLTIGGTGAMEDGKPWRDYQDSISKVVIEDGVTSIGGYAFWSCTNLTKITIPSSVTSIGAAAFDSCYDLKEIAIPSSVTSIGSSAFAYCGLMEITIPYGVTSIEGNAFRECYSLTKITIPTSVTSIGESAFQYCRGLKEITIPSSVTSIGRYAFNDCDGITKITIPSSVMSIGYMAFGWCDNLKEITIMPGVTSIGDYAFAHTVVEEVTIPSSVKNMGKYAFGGCSDLAGIYFEGDKPEFDENAFDAVTATAYYPSSNDTWADIITDNQAYGAANLTWVAKDYSADIPDTITTSSTDEAISGLTTSNVILTLPDGTEVDEIVQKTLFEEAAEYDRILEFDFYEGEDLAYSWTFDGSAITNPAQTVKFQIIIDANNAEVTSLIDEGANQIDYHFLHDGALPGPVEIKVDTKNMVSADDLYLYYYNPEAKALELIADHVPMEGKYAIFTLNHCSDYILSNTFIRSLIPNKSDDTNSNGSNAENTSNTVNTGNTGNTNNAVNTGNTGNINHVGTGTNTATASGQTGDTTPLALLAVMLCSAITAMGAVLCARQKRR